MYRDSQVKLKPNALSYAQGRDSDLSTARDHQNQALQELVKELDHFDEQMTKAIGSPNQLDPLLNDDKKMDEQMQGPTNANQYTAVKSGSNENVNQLMALTRRFQYECYKVNHENLDLKSRLDKNQLEM